MLHVHIPQREIAARQCIDGRAEHEGHPYALHTWKGGRRKEEGGRRKTEEVNKESYISIDVANLPCILE